ncbi:MAG: DUF4333 domain-containing protein [Pseudolysinimonas sp.]
MRLRRIAPLLAAASLLVALAGCSLQAEAGSTVAASKVAETAAKALEAKVGTKPKIDCGSADIVLVKGKKITCELTDQGQVYDVAITFTSVKGTTYHIDVKVADTPKNAPSASAGADAPTVTGTDIAALADQALTKQLGSAPNITCAEANVPIVVGNTTACTFTDATGVAHDVTVTISKFDGTNYTIDAKITD